MHILDKIIHYKKQEVAQQKALYPAALLEQSIYFDTSVVSLSHFIQREDKSGIIAEFKRQSPSRGSINAYAKVEEVSIAYMQAGASALSILTDTYFFGGKYEDLTEARKFNYAPILNKNFIIDEYQILQAKAAGADAILLIAACLDQRSLKKLAAFAKSLGMEVLMEIHSAEELGHLNEYIDILGVNNRDLTTFQVSLKTSQTLSLLIPSEILKISESGIKKAQDILELKSYGYQGFLIGQQFMETSYPGRACASLIRSVRSLEQENQVFDLQ
ncbi:MAG: indole-3-glycerol phosphate synthase TrpC [Saprospiraceae bacterium]|nr:indole-3-glycerol phosphate synthase TrpC [Saprospiraceae bacterium]